MVARLISLRQVRADSFVRHDQWLMVPETQGITDRRDEPNHNENGKRVIHEVFPSHAVYSLSFC